MTSKAKRWLTPSRLFGSLVLGVCTASLLSWLGKWHGSLDLLSHFRVQAAALVWLLAVASWVLGRRRIALLASLVFVLQAASIRSIASPRIPIPPGRPIAKLLYANVLSSNRDFDALLDLIHAEKPDLVALIEYNAAWQSALEPNLAEYPYRTSTVREDNFGMALFSRQPLGEPEWWTSQAGAIPSLHIAWKWQGVDWPLVLAHPFPPVGRARSEARDAQLLELIQRSPLQSPDVVLVGDMNASPWSYGYRILQRKGLRDSRLSFGLFPTWNAKWPLVLRTPIDVVMVGKAWVVASMRLGPPIGSDHMPLLVELCPKPR